MYYNETGLHAQNMNHYSRFNRFYTNKMAYVIIEREGEYSF